MKYIVKAPVEDYSGEVAGVHLVKGSYTGELTPAALAYFQGAGYEVASEEAKDAAKRPARSDNKPEWVGWAVTAHGVTPDDAEAMTKQDLIDRYDKDPEPAGPVTPPAE